MRPTASCCGSDLDLAKSIGLNTYRFNLEWARIEPVKGQFSQAMIDHYGRIIEGCHARGLTPVVTYSHFTAPLWFSAQGGWTNPESASLFARYCDRVTRAFGDRIAYCHHVQRTQPAFHPEIVLPPQVWDIQKVTLEGAAKQLGVKRFVSANVAGFDDLPELQAGLAAAHKAGKAAIRPPRRLPVGLSLSVIDDQAVGKNSIRDKMRADFYGMWIELAKSDDFVGVQN
jgi:beta-glucosidase